MKIKVFQSKKYQQFFEKWEYGFMEGFIIALILCIFLFPIVRPLELVLAFLNILILWRVSNEKEKDSEKTEKNKKKAKKREKEA